MKHSQITELSIEEYVDKSLVPGCVIKLVSSDSSVSEKLLMVGTYPAPLLLFRIHYNVPKLIQSDPRLRAKQIAIGPGDLTYLNRKAWVDCTGPDEEFTYEEVRSTLIGEPERIVGNIRKETMKKINDAIKQ